MAAMATHSEPWALLTDFYTRQSRMPSFLEYLLPVGYLQAVPSSYLNPILKT